MNNIRFDITGAIHGHSDRLVNELLRRLGYDCINGIFMNSDSNEEAIYAGDFIDQVKIRETLSIIKCIVEN